MTYEEAIKMLSRLAQIRSDGYYDYLANGGKADDSFDNEMMAFAKAIEALEKQLPKKPIDNHHCPSCETGLPHKGFTDEWCKCCFELDYCPRCGQAIDWSDEE